MHDESLIAAVKRLGADPTGYDERHGLGSEDNPAFHDMHRAAAHVVGASVDGASKKVWLRGRIIVGAGDENAEQPLIQKASS